MRQLFPKKQTIFVVLVIIVTAGLFFNIMGMSIYRSVVTFQRSEPDKDVRVVVDKSQPTVNSKYELGYTEKQRPIVRIYESLPAKETNAEKMKRFEQIQKWLKDNKNTKPEVKPECTNITKVILWYDVYHGGTGVRNKCRKVDFSKCECSCELDFFIYNETQNLLTYEPFGGDAVLLQLNKLLAMNHPPLKRDGQVFVAVEREATPRSKIPLQNFEYVFNWTMTFRQDSDIFYPYGRVIEKSSIPPAKNYSEIFKRKKKSIVWFVSHCKTKSKREAYAEELKKYIDLDIVGHCGADICPKHSRKCLPNFEEEYFFRFNFENTFHRDYVTEKLFENFSKDMIQIVGGSAEYDNIAPEYTVIDVKDFDSPKALATYLKILMNSEEHYTEYLKTKDKYYTELLAEQSQRAYCELCSMLHNLDRHRNLYYSIGDWFVS